MDSFVEIFAGTIGSEAVFMLPVFIMILFVVIPQFYNVKMDGESITASCMIIIPIGAMRVAAMKYFTEYVLSAAGNRISPTITICVCMFVVSLVTVLLLLVFYSQFRRNTNAYYELFIPRRYIFWINILLSAYLSIGAYVDGANFASAIAASIPFFVFIKKLMPPE